MQRPQFMTNNNLTPQQESRLRILLKQVISEYENKRYEQKLLLQLYKDRRNDKKIKPTIEKIEDTMQIEDTIQLCNREIKLFESIQQNIQKKQKNDEFNTTTKR